MGLVHHPLDMQADIPRSDEPRHIVLVGNVGVIKTRHQILPHLGAVAGCEGAPIGLLQIAIGEGCGSGTTEDTFRANGYTELASKYRMRLIDFNCEKAITLKRSMLKREAG